jgi:chromosome segregation ATPase
MSRIADLKARVADLEDTLRQGRDGLDPPHAIIARLRRQVAERQEMVEHLRGELGEAQSRTEFYKRELRDYQRTIVQHGQSLFELRADLAAAQRHAFDMEAERDQAITQNAKRAREALDWTGDS